MRNFRTLWIILALATAGCSSNRPAQTDDQGSQTTTNEETSWYCEQGVQTWSCERRTITDIQARQQARKNKRFDWSLAIEAGLTERTATPPTAPSAEAKSEDAATWPGRQQAQSLSAPGGIAQPRTIPKQWSDAELSLRDLPADHWAVQLIALASEPELQAFINAQELDELSRATVRVKGKIFYIALLGVYPNRLAAEQAAVARPASLQRYEPYIRSMASLQTAMAAVSGG